MAKISVAYYRVSTTKQGISGLGLKGQQTAVKNFLKGKQPAYSFTEVESGKKNNRPELEKALSLCKKKKGRLIVAKLDRLSRDLHFITSLEKAKIDFVCCDMPQADKFTIHIMGSLAQWEREQISRRTKQALAELKKKGTKLGYNNPKIRKALKAYWKIHKAPVKSKVIKKKLLKIKEPLIRKANQWAESMRPTMSLLKEKGLTLEQTAQKLTSMKVRTRQGFPVWGKTQVHRLNQRLGL